MKLLTRDTSAFKFLTLGGLLSKKKFDPSIRLDVPSVIAEGAYLGLLPSFGVDEENVRDFIIKLLRDDLGWTTVRRDHDVLAVHGEEKIVIECKRYDSKLLYLDDHKGGQPGETAVEELQRNLQRHGAKWGVLTDGVTFRFYFNGEISPELFECYLEFSLQDIISSTHRWPSEFYWLFDFLSPNSTLRKLDPTKLDVMNIKDVRKIVSLIKNNSGSLFTVLKALAVATLEDMGVRPLHTGIKSIRSLKSKKEFLEVFQSIASDDPDFHQSSHSISDSLCTKINSLFAQLSHVDFCHVDHEFFGIVYQKFINNGNASHYTNTKLSKETANYIACQSTKSQRAVRPIYLETNDFILDPALGSGQLLRGLLPFHRVFFRGHGYGIDGWRRLASHFMGRDIDEVAIWVAKINIWLATADKGEALVSLPEFKKLDVITSTINRRAGETIREAFRINPQFNVAGCVSNPPWDAFKNDKRRGVSYDQETVNKIKASLSIEVRQLNRAQIFLKIIQKLGEECRNMRFAVILPDSIFVDTNDDIRKNLRDNLDFYFSYPRNMDPESKTRIFGDVDNTRKFGIIFGRSATSFEQLICYPFGNDKKIVVDPEVSKIGKNSAFPLFSHPIQFSIVQKWKRSANRTVEWKAGEFDQSLWESREGREEGTSGRHLVIGGAAFCDEANAWSKNPIDRSKKWKKMISIADTDRDLSKVARTIFSDYINNSKKLNSASYLPKDSGINITNTLIYSVDTSPTDCLIYDSLIFGTFVEVYGTSQHMNAWRLCALGLPKALTETDPIDANIELCANLGITLNEALVLYELNSSWMSLAISKEEWGKKIGNQLVAEPEILEEKRRIKKLRKKAPARARRG